MWKGMINGFLKVLNSWADIVGIDDKTANSYAENNKKEEIWFPTIWPMNNSN
jgi:hypothetical protein